MEEESKWTKKLSKNDIDSSQSHQSGINVLKADFDFFDQIDTSKKIDNAEIIVIGFNNERLAWKLNWYASKREIHLTHCTPYLRSHGVGPGDTIGLIKCRQNEHQLFANGDSYDGHFEKRIEDKMDKVFTGKSAAGQGFLQDVEKKNSIESFAMKVAKSHFENSGYTVEDTSSGNPYDLMCAKKGKKLIVEVKGTTTDGSKVNLTKNEVQQFQKSYPETALAVVSEIECEKVGKKYQSSGGLMSVYRPWKPAGDDLIPTQFFYSLKSLAADERKKV